jgi:hypothetical protein
MTIIKEWSLRRTVACCITLVCMDEGSYRLEFEAWKNEGTLFIIVSRGLLLLLLLLLAEIQ